MNVEAVFVALVGFGATWVLWLLLGLSVVLVAIVLERTVFFFMTKEKAGTLQLQVARSLERGEGPVMKRKLDESSSIEARVVASALGSARADEAEERMASEAEFQRLRAEKYLAFLGTLGNNAPFVGLLGTVIGIIGAFHELDASGGQLTAGLMAEIGEALVATAVGLLVALPAVAAANVFNRLITVRIAAGEAIARQVLAHLYLSQSEGGVRKEPAPVRARAS